MAVYRAVRWVSHCKPRNNKTEKNRGNGLTDQPTDQPMDRHSDLTSDLQNDLNDLENDLNEL